MVFYPMNQPLSRSDLEARQHWMAVLSRASVADLNALVSKAGSLPPYQLLKAPLTGTIMIEARAGGTGQRFNAGEATMTRCVVLLETGQMGFSYALGRDTEKAEKAAVIEALLQQDTSDGAWRIGIRELASRQAEAKHLSSRKAATTKVDFFTLVRGE